MLTVILLIVAAICFGLAILRRCLTGWVPLGLLAWVLVPLIAALR